MGLMHLFIGGFADAQWREVTHGQQQHNVHVPKSPKVAALDRATFDPAILSRPLDYQVYKRVRFDLSRDGKRSDIFIYEALTVEDALLRLLNNYRPPMADFDPLK